MTGVHQMMKLCSSGHCICSMSWCQLMVSVPFFGVLSLAEVCGLRIYICIVLQLLLM